MRRLRVNDYVIKAQIEDIITLLQLTLSNGKLRDVKHGTENIVITCPIHGGGRESHPACNIYIGEDSKLPYGYFNCFVCGSNGSFLKFVASCFESSEDYALTWLLKNFDSEKLPKIFDLGEPISLEPKKATTVVLDETILDRYLTWHSYLGDRKLSRATCEKFKVRYDPEFRQIIFPTYNLENQLVMLSKRSIDTKTFYLDFDVEKPVYCLNYIKKAGYKTAVITEGPFDTLTGWEYGFPTCGTFGRLSPRQISDINRSGITTLYTAFDNDEAGKIFTRVLKARLSNRIIVKELVLPAHRKDVNECTKEEFYACLAVAQNSAIKTSYNIKSLLAKMPNDIK